MAEGWEAFDHKKIKQKSNNKQQHPYAVLSGSIMTSNNKEMWEWYGQVLNVNTQTDMFGFY